MDKVYLIVGIIIFLAALIAFIYKIFITIKNNKKVNISKNKKIPKTKKDKPSSKLPKNISNLIPFSAYDVKEDCYNLCDNSIMDIIKIVSKDLQNSSEDEVDYDIMKLAKLFKTYSDDMKLIAMNFPCNTANQQNYWLDKKGKNKNKEFDYWINKNIMECQYIENNCSSKEFYFMIFSENIEEHKKTLNHFINTLGTGMDGLIELLTSNKKHQIIYKLNNKNSLMIQGGIVTDEKE